MCRCLDVHKQNSICDRGVFDTGSRIFVIFYEKKNKEKKRESDCDVLLLITKTEKTRALYTGVLHSNMQKREKVEIEKL